MKLNFTKEQIIMTLSKTLISIAVIASASISLNVRAESVNPKELKQTLTQKGEIEGIQELPIEDLMLVETKQGKTYFVSKNGRFVFQGKLIDNWFRRTINTVSEAKAAHRVPLDKMGVKLDELATLSFGNQDIPKQATIIVDPNCGYCHALFNKIKASPEKYNVDFVLTALLGPESLKESKRLHCAADKSLAVIDLLNSTKLAKEMRNDCDSVAINKAPIVMGLLEARGTPFLIREDGLTLNGLPNDFDAWLAQE